MGRVNVDEGAGLGVFVFELCDWRCTATFNVSFATVVEWQSLLTPTIDISIDIMRDALKYLLLRVIGLGQKLQRLRTTWLTVNISVLVAFVIEEGWIRWWKSCSR